MVSEQLVQSFTRLALSPDPDLAIAALMIARIEYPKLDARPYLEQLDSLGREAAVRVSGAGLDPSRVPPRVDPEAFARVSALNEYLFDELKFVGNDVQFEDPRNSFLNEVLDRRTGIPITLALVYMEVARRAGVEIQGVNMPGHFMLRCPAPLGTRYTQDLIIDAHHGGAIVTETACREMLRKHVGDSAAWDTHLLEQPTKSQILVRMLLNLKRVYVRMCSFPQARDITDLMLGVDPAAFDELRDRGLLAYHLRDYAAALRDLQTYLRLSPKSSLDDEERDEREQIWEHVKTLRRRVASLN
ncbi:MAG: tetratricopeptide repeat protein [Luteitalea sp.]|nr:tetratricopeptide repeat protein [Luteitalea sp.]